MSALKGGYIYYCYNRTYTISFSQSFSVIILLKWTRHKVTVLFFPLKILIRNS